MGVRLSSFIPGTAFDVGLIDAFDPNENIDASAKYLRDQFDHLPEAATDSDRWKLALGSYNAGRGNINEAMRLYVKSEGINTTGSLSGVSGKVTADTLLNDYLPKITSTRSTETIGYVRNIVGKGDALGGLYSSYKRDF